MNTLQTERFDIIEAACVRPSLSGPLPCVLANVIHRDDIFPTVIVASVLLVRTRKGWVIGHLLVEDEARQCGVATEVVQFYENRLGSIGAAWVSESGTAFAKRYVAKFGPRPLWQIGTDKFTEALVQRVLGHRKAVTA